MSVKQVVMAAAGALGGAEAYAPDFKWSTSLSNGSIAITNDGRTATNGGSGYQTSFASLPTTADGKYYWEVTETVSNNYGNTGLGTSTSNAQFYQDTSGNYFIQRSSDSSFTRQGSWSYSSLASTVYSSASVRFGYAYEVNSGKVWIRIDGGSWIGGGNPTTSTTPTVTISGTVFLVGSSYDSSSQSFTIASRTDLADSPPTDFVPIGGTGGGTPPGGGGISLTWYLATNTGGSTFSLPQAITNYSSPSSFISDNSAGTTGSESMKDNVIVVKFSSPLTSDATATVSLSSGSYWFAGYSTNTDLATGSYSNNISDYTSKGSGTCTIPSGAKWFYIGSGELGVVFSNLYITGGGL